MCDVTTAVFVINLTSAEILGWVVTRYVTALQRYFPMTTMSMRTRDAASRQVQGTVRSPVKEMLSVSTQLITTVLTSLAMENVDPVRGLCVRMKR